MALADGRRVRLFAVLACALAAIATVGCPGAPATEHPLAQPAATVTGGAAPVAPPPAAPTAAPADAVAQRADQMMARARVAEPQITSLMERLAAEAGGKLIKLQYRLKTRSSIMRKIRLRMTQDPSLTPPAVTLDDTLRYTLVVVDDPPGRHVAAIKTVIGRLNREGHHLLRLKNYWPDGDNYSGCNSSLRAPDGLLWELQFHTPASAATSERTRDWYEELRRTDTPVERKRELFDRMTAEWAKVPIPRGILEPGALDPAAEIIDRPRP